MKSHFGSKGPGKCGAKEGNCPFGGDDVHFGTIVEARVAYEKKMSQEMGSVKTISREPRNYWADVPPIGIVEGPQDEKSIADYSEEEMAAMEANALEGLRTSYSKLTDSQLKFMTTSDDPDFETEVEIAKEVLKDREAQKGNENNLTFSELSEKLNSEPTIMDRLGAIRSDISAGDVLKTVKNSSNRDAAKGDTVAYSLNPDRLPNNSAYTWGKVTKTGTRSGLKYVDVINENNELDRIWPDGSPSGRKNAMVVRENGSGILQKTNTGFAFTYWDQGYLTMSDNFKNVSGEGLDAVDVNYLESAILGNDGMGSPKFYKNAGYEVRSGETEKEKYEEYSLNALKFLDKARKSILGAGK